MLPFAASTHLKDWIVRTEDGVPRWEDRPLGRGEARVADVYSLLRRERPDLPLTIEVPTRGSCRAVTPADEDRNVVESVRFARSLDHA